MQQESKPEDIDRLDHDILTLRIELAALKKERDAASKYGGKFVDQGNRGLARAS
jgi:hypothetical protein